MTVRRIRSWETESTGRMLNEERKTLIQQAADPGGFPA
jgi:hypothetical protein